ncbi:unnamed protein product, partial [Ectocarpus sp. 8 AP-2014]
RNAQDEYITTVTLHSSGGDGHSSSSSSSAAASDALPSRCVVEDYTRDASVMGTRAGGAGAVTLVAVRDADKLKSFRSYLAGRKKAGVVKLPGGGRLMLLPTVADPRDVSGESIVGLIQQQQRGGGAVLARSPAAAAPPLLPPQQPHSLAYSNSSNTPAPPPPRAASSSRNSVSSSGGGGASG